ncbi:MAG TPA: transposase [Anaeromyxobacteraceae bacterium]|nr:transposase [Anaeromyxobacteraceae bacterium]
MHRYIGLDAHAQSCSLGVRGSTGKRLGLQVVDTNGAALKDAIRAIPGIRHLCMEEGTQSAWLYELLEPEVDDIVVIVPEKRFGSKDDARDALSLAEDLRVGAIKRRVYKRVGPYSELRAAVRSYMQLRSDVQRAKSRLKAIYLSRGLHMEGTKVYQRKNDTWDRQLPPAQRRSVEILRVELGALTDLWAEAEERLLQASRKHPIVQTLATAPAIGPIRAAQIVAVVLAPHRFRTKRQFWAYCGLAIVMRSSSDWVKDRHGHWVRAQTSQTRGLNRNRQPLLKEVFKSAAHQVATQMTKHPLHHAYMRLIEGGMKPELAQLTIARRLAAAVLAMWKHEEVYDPERHCMQMTAQA